MCGRRRGGGWTFTIWGCTWKSRRQLRLVDLADCKKFNMPQDIFGLIKERGEKMAVQGISGIEKLWEVMPLTKAEAVEAAPVGGSFGDIFRSAIETVRETDAEKSKAEYLLSTGQLDDPAVLTIAETKAGYAVDLLIQLRNKAVDAYNELMRISL